MQVENENSILVIAPEEDPHAISICRELGRAGKKYSFLQFGKISDCAITFRIDEKNFEAHAAAGLQRLVPPRVKSLLWVKQPDIAPVAMTKRQDEIFATHEIRHCFSSLWSILNARWINFPGHIARASYLPEQLIKAKRLGAQVAPYLLSNNRETIGSFMATQDRTIYEPFSALPPEMAPRGTHDDALLAREKYHAVECDTVQDYCRFDANYPLFLRRVPPKGRIHRYVAIGEKVLCYASEDFGGAASFKMARQRAFEAVRGNAEGVRVCGMLRSAYKLRFCVCDFVVDGEAVSFWGMVPAIEYLDWLSQAQAADVSREIAGDLAAGLN